MERLKIIISSFVFTLLVSGCGGESETEFSSEIFTTLEVNEEATIPAGSKITPLQEGSRVKMTRNLDKDTVTVLVTSGRVEIERAR